MAPLAAWRLSIAAVGLHAEQMHISISFIRVLPQFTMPVFEFRLEQYDRANWYHIWPDNENDLKQEELMAFAPKALVAQAEIQPPPSPRVVLLPFMKLPLELRTMVYKIYFFQPAEPHHFVPPEQRLSLCFRDELLFGRCPIRTFNGRVSCASIMGSLKRPVSRSDAALFPSHGIHVQQLRVSRSISQRDRTLPPTARD